VSVKEKSIFSEIWPQPDFSALLNKPIASSALLIELLEYELSFQGV